METGLRLGGIGGMGVGMEQLVGGSFTATLDLVLVGCGLLRCSWLDHLLRE